MKFKIGTLVKLPFDETGIIKEINTKSLDWFPYKVKIRKVVFNKTNQIIEYKLEHLQMLL